MALHLTKEFLNDLREAEDVRFIRQVLNHTIGQDGSFTPNRDDHRYNGIRDAWVRYVSRGTTAYRVVFIRSGPDVFLYRAGRHTIEDNLPPPTALAAALRVRTASAAQQPISTNAVHNDCLLKTTEADFINRHFESMYHVRHKEIYLVSPFIELPMLEGRHPFGRFLDRAMEEDTLVVLITSSDQDDGRLPAFANLDARGVNLFFMSRLHTKLYLFDVDLVSRNAWQQGIQAHAIIGSSNLTYAGLGFVAEAPNEELNYSLSSDLLDKVRTYATRLTIMADDYMKYLFNTRRRIK